MGGRVPDSVEGNGDGLNGYTESAGGELVRRTIDSGGKVGGKGAEGSDGEAAGQTEEMGAGGRGNGMGVGNGQGREGGQGAGGGQQQQQQQQQLLLLQQVQGGQIESDRGKVSKGKGKDGHTESARGFREQWGLAGGKGTGRKEGKAAGQREEME